MHSWEYCERCKKPVLVFSAQSGDGLPLGQHILLVLFDMVVVVTGVFCPDCMDIMLKNGKVINPFILKDDVDKAISEGKIVI